jgi:IS30 family transposase
MQDRREAESYDDLQAYRREQVARWQPVSQPAEVWKTRWKGGKRNKKAGARLIPDRVDIAERPDVVDTRERLGDWEGDTVHGQGEHLVTLVDRASRFTLAKLKMKSQMR